MIHQDLLSTRRAVLLGTGAMAIAACTKAQRDAALIKVQLVFADATAAAERWFGSILIAQGIMEAIRDANAKVQAATTITELVREAIRVFALAVTQLVALAQFSPVPIPPVILTTLQTIAGALAAFLSRPAGPQPAMAARDGMPVPPEPDPLDTALAALPGLRVP